MKNNLSVRLCGLELGNPVMPASGCFGFGREYAAFYDLSRLGAIVVKATTEAARQGNPTPRVTEVTGGMLNSIGLANPGVDAVVHDELPWLRRFRIPIIVNVAGSTVEEYCRVVRTICGGGVADAIELNVSCPNVKTGGIAFGTDAHVLQDLVKRVRKECSLPLIVKLSPNVTDIRSLALAAQEGGADGLSLINTLVGMAVDVRRRQAVLGAKIGGFSGPGMKAVAVRMVYEVAQTVEVPIIGIGGIYTAEDVLEFIMVGATAVQVGTANFTDPHACPRIIEELPKLMTELGITSLQEIRGCAQ